MERSGRPLKIRIVHVITKMELGGAQMVALSLAQGLDPEQYEGWYVTGQEGDLMAHAKALSTQGIHVIELDHLVRPVSFWRDLLALSRMVRMFRRIRPHIVHTHSSKAGFLGRAAAHLAQVPVVMHTVHGFPFHSYQSMPLRWLYRFLEQWAATWTNAVVVVSPTDQAKGLEAGVGRPSQYRLIRNGIDLSRFSAVRNMTRSTVRRALGFDQHGPLVGSVACFKPQKAPLDFLEMARQCLRTRPEMKFVMAGDGELRPPIERFIAANGMGHAVRLLGWRTDIPELLRSLDCLVLTSLWEGLPLVILEAMAAGTPVIATRVDGILDALGSGERGQLIPPRRPDLMAQHVLKLFEHPNEADRSIEAGRTWLTRECDQSSMIKNYHILYQELANP